MAPLSTAANEQLHVVDVEFQRNRAPSAVSTISDSVGSSDDLIQSQSNFNDKEKEKAEQPDGWYSRNAGMVVFLVTVIAFIAFFASTKTDSQTTTRGLRNIPAPKSNKLSCDSFCRGTSCRSECETFAWQVCEQAAGSTFSGQVPHSIQFDCHDFAIDVVETASEVDAALSIKYERVLASVALWRRRVCYPLARDIRITVQWTSE